MRLLAYHDVPGILIGPEYFSAQKVLASSSKRVKIETPSNDPSEYFLNLSLHSLVSFISIDGIPTRLMHEFQGCSESALSAAHLIAQQPLLEPSRTALKAHVADLEADLRNVDFRLQNFYHQRCVISGILEDAVARLSDLPN